MITKDLHALINTINQSMRLKSDDGIGHLLALKQYIENELSTSLKNIAAINKALTQINNICYQRDLSPAFISSYIEIFGLTESQYDEIIRRPLDYAVATALVDDFMRNAQLQAGKGMHTRTYTALNKQNIDDCADRVARHCLEFALSGSLEHQHAMITMLLNDKSQQHIASLLEPHESAVTQWATEPRFFSCYTGYRVGIDLVRSGLREAGMQLIASCANPRPFELLEYEQVTGTEVTRSMFEEGRLPLSSLLGYLLERPERIDAFRGYPLVFSYEVLSDSFYVIQSNPLWKEAGRLTPSITMILESWSGTQRSLNELLWMASNHCKDDMSAYSDSLFNDLARRYYESYPDLTGVLVTARQYGKKVVIDRNDPTFMTMRERMLGNLALAQLREVLNEDHPGRVFGRDDVVWAVEANWDRWTDAEHASAKQKAQPWLMEQAKPLKRARLERDMSI